MFVIASRTANGYWPGAAGVPCATAAAGTMPRPPISSEDSSATATATAVRRADMRTPRFPPRGAAHATYTRNRRAWFSPAPGNRSGRRGDVAGDEHAVDGLDPR